MIFVVALADQLSKWTMTELVIRTSQGQPPIPLFPWLMDAPERLGPARIEVLPFYNLVMVWNEGVSFGVFNTGESHALMPLILSGFSLALSFIFMLWMFSAKDRTTVLALILIIGGAIGNVYDRLRFGAVIDFLDFHIGSIHWPAFNLADSFIVLGVMALIASSLFFEKNASSPT